MHIDSFSAECRQRYGKIALSRESAAFAEGQTADFGGNDVDPDESQQWAADGGDDAAGLAD